MGRSFQLGPWKIEPDLNSISANGQVVHLEPKAMEVLVRLTASPGESVSKDELIRAVWPDTFVGDDALARAIYELRKGFHDDPHQPRIIQTIAKRGYRLIAPVAGPEHGSRHRLGARAVALTALVLFAILVGIGLVARWRTLNRQVPIQSEIMFSEQNEAGVAWFALSPDGRQLAFVAGNPGPLWVRDLRDGSQHKLAEVADCPFWSPDSQQLGYFGEGMLKRVPAAGGPAQVLAKVMNGWGWYEGSWSSRGMIVFSSGLGPEKPLYVVADTGGTPHPLTELPAEGKWSHRNPHFLPDGRTFLYVARDLGKQVGALYAGSVEGGKPTLILEAASNAEYANGYLLYARDGTLIAQHFDPEKLVFDGPAKPLAPVRWRAVTDFAQFSVSGANILVYRSPEPAQSQFGWYSREGRLLATVGAAAAFGGGRQYWPSISPDGRKVTVWLWGPERQAGGDINLLDLRDGTLLPVTHASAGFGTAIFSPDGTRMAVTLGPTAGRGQLLILRSDGSQPEQVLLRDTGFWVMDWSRDGRYLIGDGACGENRWCLQYVDLEQEPRAIPIVQKSAGTERPMLSPDGKWVAYNSFESGTQEVYVTAFPGPGPTFRISNAGGVMPQWSPDGTKLCYLRDEHTVMVVRVHEDASFSFDPPQILFQLPQRIILFRIASGGDRFLVQTVDSKPLPLELVVNWEEMLK